MTLEQKAKVIQRALAKYGGSDAPIEALSNESVLVLWKECDVKPVEGVTV